MKTKYPIAVHLRERKIANDKVALYLDVLRNGKRWKEALHLTLLPGSSRQIRAVNEETRTKAMIIRAQREEQLKNEMVGVYDQKNNYLGLFYPFFESCMNSFETKTRVTWQHALLYLKNYDDNESLTFADITPKWCEGFVNYLQTAKSFLKSKKNISKGTAFLIFSKLVACLNRAKKQNIIKHNPCDNIVRTIKKGESAIREFLTKDELALIVKTPIRNKTAKNAFLFACLTGLRYSDIEQLRWRDLVDVNGKIIISIVMEKTEESVHIPLNASAAKLIGERGKDSDLIFPGLNYVKATYTIKTLVKKAGIKKNISFHCSRHTFATQLLDNGVDIYTVSKLLGHTEITTTQVYAKLLDSKKQSAVDAIDNLIDL